MSNMDWSASDWRYIHSAILTTMGLSCSRPKVTGSEQYHHIGPRLLQTEDAPCNTYRNKTAVFQNKGTLYIVGAGFVCWLERRTRDRKVASSNPGRNGGRILFSRVNFVYWLLVGVRSITVLPRWNVKDPGHSTKSAGGRLHPNNTRLSQRSRSGLTIQLCRHGVGTYQETSLHATRQKTFGHRRLSSPSHKCARPKFYLKNKTKQQQQQQKRSGVEWIVEHSPKILAREEKAKHTMEYQ